MHFPIAFIHSFIGKTGKCPMEGGVVSAKAVPACITHPAILHLWQFTFLHAGLKSNHEPIRYAFYCYISAPNKGKDPLLHIVLNKLKELVAKP